MSDWKEYKLDELVEITSSKRIMRSEYQENGIPFFRSKEIIELNSGNEITTELFISKERFLEIKNKFGTPSYGDILLTSVGTLGVPYFVNYKEEFYFKDGNLTWFRKFNNILRSKYLYYWFSSPVGRKALKEITIGSTQPALTITGLKSLTIHLPTLEEQDYIIEILDHLSSKIQLNTQINQTLEQIAQALFKSWFIDFDPVRAKVQALSDGLSLEQAELAAMQATSGKTPEELTALSQAQPDHYAELAETAKAFPCEMVEVDGVEVPKGWDNQSVGDVINVVDYVANGSFATLKENVTLLTEPDYAIYVRTTDFNSGFSKELRYVNKSAYDFLAKSVLIGNEVIISNVGDVGTVFRSPSWLGMPMTLGSNAIALKNYDIPHYLYLYFSSHKGQHDISSIVTGSAQLKFNKTNFRSLKVLMPNNSLLTKFEKFLLPIFEKIDANMAENLKLAEIRDLLLPRLLNGEIE